MRVTRAMSVNKRGRRRKHDWIEFKDLESDTSVEARYLRWVSINNPALAQSARDGCPQCHVKSFRFRHDKKFNNIRFYCPSCGYETSYHIILPKQSFRTIEVFDKKGMFVGLKKVDDFHEKTSRENADARVLNAERRLDLGGEWFDGVSGTNSQSRSLSREEILKRIETRRMRRQMAAMLEEIEREEREGRVSGFRADVHGEEDID
jgi:ribosomal protein S27AE